MIKSFLKIFAQQTAESASGQLSIYQYIIDELSPELKKFFNCLHRLITYLLLSTILYSCTTTDNQNSRPSAISIEESLNNDIASTINRANKLPPNQSAQLLLNLAKQLVEKDSSNTEEAKEILGQISLDDVRPSLYADILLFTLELGQTEATEVLTKLSPSNFPDLSELSPENVMRFHSLRAQALELNNADPLPAILERIYIAKLVVNNDQLFSTNKESLWNLLKKLSDDQLETMASTALDDEVRGWYELALTNLRNRLDLQASKASIEQWQSVHPRHSANKELPKELVIISQIAEQPKTQLALLLPLQNPAGIIVRDSFLSAYYALLKEQIDKSKMPTIRLYDTSEASSIVVLHEEAVADGADMVIGPLLKNEVEQLLDVPELGAPTLALNDVANHPVASPELYQFTLAPEDEATQLAKKAWEAGLRRIALLYPLGEQRKREALTHAWTMQGGTIVIERPFGQEDYTTMLSKMLELTQSNLRKESLSRVIQKNIEFTPRRRQDLDGILLIASPQAGRQINPSLSYLYAGELPVYSTSDIYSGKNRPLEDRDLNEVIFGEAPWLLGERPKLFSEIGELLPQGSAQIMRLQAFALDAFYLYPRLPLLKFMGERGLKGNTGTLILNADNKITRSLRWVKITSGIPEIIP